MLLAGERLGVGLIESGRLLHGSQGGAGEMAYLDRVEGVGNADGIALLARMWGAEAVAAAPRRPRSARGRWRARAPSPPRWSSPRRSRAIESPADILDRLTTRLAMVIATLGTIFNPELLVIAGAVSQSAGALLGRHQRTAAGAHRHPPRVAASTLGESVVSIGAIRLALNHVQDNALDLDVARAG